MGFADRRCLHTGAISNRHSIRYLEPARDLGGTTDGGSPRGGAGNFTTPGADETTGLATLHSEVVCRSGWSHLFTGGRTPVGNPGLAMLSESKRLPLNWEELKTEMGTWKKLLPETCDPHAVDWEHDPDWIAKSAYCNTGDTVSIRSELDSTKWKQVVREVRRRPEEWIAQKRFEPVWFESPSGPMHACIGVYTINGARAGAYVRITNRALIDYVAIDAALLVEDNK